MKIAFIINPKSGTDNKASLPDKIAAVFDASPHEITVQFTLRKGHAHEMAAQYAAEGYDVVVACGGDGTVNEVASALVHTQTALAIVPSGSGNGLARHLGVPMNSERALQIIADGYVTTIDYGKAGQRMFFCTCGTGFDAHISHAFSTDGKRGFFTYLKIIIREYLSYKPDVYSIKASGIKVVFKAFLVTFANASQYGNNAYIAPHASTEDGEMEVCILKPFSILASPLVAFRLMTKQIEGSRFFTIVRAKEVVLMRKGAGEFHIDGEPKWEQAEIKIGIVPSGLRVVCPQSVG